MHREGTLKVPATQVGDDGRGLGAQDKEPVLSSPPLCGNTKNASATLECLPFAAESEARRLQNFSLFPHLLAVEDEEVLELEKGEPFPDEDLDDW